MSEQATAPAVPAKKKPSPVEVYGDAREHYLRVFGDTKGAEAFVREVSFAAQIINASEGLQKTTLSSRLIAVANVANIQLTLNPVLKLAYLVPRSVKVTGENGAERWESRCFLEPSYMGLVKLACDTGTTRHVDAQIVYEGDDIEIVKGTDPKVVHVPFWKTGREKGKILAAYAYAVLTDGSISLLDMPLDELVLVKSASEAAAKGRKSPYDKWEAEMFRKAPIRRLFKLLPKSDRNEMLFHAIGLDEEQFGSINAEQSQKGEDEARRELWRTRLRDAIDFYDGDDKEEIREQCKEAVQNGSLDEAFVRKMLEKMGHKLEA